MVRRHYGDTERGRPAVPVEWLKSEWRTRGLLKRVFALAGVVVGVEEWLEDSLAAELVPQSQHGTAFGTLPAVNAVGDFASSFVIGILWTAASPSIAFGLSGMLFLLGSVLLLRSR